MVRTRIVLIAAAATAPMLGTAAAQSSPQTVIVFNPCQELSVPAGLLQRFQPQHSAEKLLSTTGKGFVPDFAAVVRDGRLENSGDPGGPSPMPMPKGPSGGVGPNVGVR